MMLGLVQSFIVAIIAFWSEAALFAQDAPPLVAPIKGVKAQFDVDANKDFVASINDFLQGFINREGSADNRRLAEDFVRSLYGVLAVDCKYHDKADGRTLVCAITSKRTIRKIAVTHLPASLLEDELKRRLSIDVGQTIDIDEKLGDLLNTVKGRVETFLRKNGYYDAKVSVTHDAPASAVWADIKIDIDGGLFARVNNVVVTGDTIISHGSVQKLFSRMCLSFKRVIDSIAIGTLACYSRETEGETIVGIQDRLAKKGYIQSQIRVSHYWIDPTDKNAPKNCRSIDGKSPAYRCVNLRVNIEQGPLFKWKVNIKDRLAISRNAMTRFIASIFSVDQLSRASTSFESDEVALDHFIDESDAAKEITFVHAKNVDEQELSESAEQITDFLVAKGYTNAEVIPNLVQEDESNVVVNFDVYANRPFFVNSVNIFPASFQRFVDDEYLKSLVPERSFMSNGGLSYKAIDSVKDDVVSRLKARGFREPSVNVTMESSSNGAVDVTLHVTSTPRETLREIIIINGRTEQNEEIVPYLQNCDAYEAAHDKKQKQCQESSFVPDKVEEDSQKLADFYQTNGYLYARVAHEIVEGKDGRRLIFTIFDNRRGEKDLTPLEQQNINDIIIFGNTATSSSAIKRLFRKQFYRSVLDPLAIKKGLSRLRESGRFSRIDHKVMFAQENGDDAYFLLQVAERPSLTLDTSIAFSTDQHFSFETELEEGNLFASMLKLNTTLGLGLFWGRQSLFSNKLMWPYILGYPVRLTLTAPIIVYDDRLHYKDPHRRLQSKLSARFDWRLTSLLTPYIEYWLVFTQEDRFTDRPLPSSSFKDSLSSLDGLIPTMRVAAEIQGVLKPGISLIQLDNAFDPHSGVDVNLWTELSGGPLLGKPRFVNVGIQNRFYIPMGPLTLAMQATFMRAFIKPNEENWKRLGNVSAMGKLGGDRSVRGFNADDIGITDYRGESSKYAGYFSNLANIELRFPLTSKSSMGNFSGAVFVDEGMVIPCGGLFKCLDKVSSARLAPMRGIGFSVGAALRYSLPVGPISLDYGISPITGDNRVHILFGYSF